jgi:hypothetical protein
MGFRAQRQADYNRTLSQTNRAHKGYSQLHLGVLLSEIGSQNVDMSSYETSQTFVQNSFAVPLRTQGICSQNPVLPVTQRDNHDRFLWANGLLSNRLMENHSLLLGQTYSRRNSAQGTFVS